MVGAATDTGAPGVVAQAVVKERATLLRAVRRPKPELPAVAVFDAELVALLAAKGEDGFDWRLCRQGLCWVNRRRTCSQPETSLRDGGE